MFIEEHLFEVMFQSQDKKDSDEALYGRIF